MSAEGPRLCPFPMLVQGGWESPNLPKPLRNKLLCYFQSRKRSGGGECEVRQQAGQILVFFAQEEVRQRVVSKKIHELDLAGRETLKLVVSLYETTDTAKEYMPKKEMIPEPAPGEDQTEKMDVRDDQETENVVLGSESAGEDPCAEAILIPVQAFPRVVLENVEESLQPDTLSLLVDAIVGLSEDNAFQIELISEIKVAVITFQRSIDATNFLRQCTKSFRFQQYKLSARPLELTPLVKVENIPAGTSSEFITLYFESPKHGGGQVSNIQMLPKENAALVTFCDSQAVLTVLEKTHSFSGHPVLVCPYYSSLDTALYGKERSQIKMPESIAIPLDPYIWQFLQGQDKLTQEIDKEMANCFCELIWPQGISAHPEVMLCPSSILARQRRSIRELVKSWKDKVSEEFTCILSKFRAVKCKIIPEAWETIENNLIKNVLAVPDESKAFVTLAGFAVVVSNVEKQVKEYTEHLTKDAEIARQMLQQTVSIAPVKYVILHRLLLEENTFQETAELKWCYDASAKQLQLSGTPAEVYKMKSDLLEKVHSIGEKNVSVHPSIFQFLQRADPEKVSAVLFETNKINAAYELAQDYLVLVGLPRDGLLKAEKQIKKDLNHECIILEDQKLIHKREWKELIKALQSLHSFVDNTVIIDVCIALGEGAKVVIAGYTNAVADVFQQLSVFIERNTQMQKEISAKTVGTVQFLEKEKGKVWQDMRRRGLKIDFGLQKKNISLSGSKTEMTKAVIVVEQILSSVYSVNVLFDKPGVKAFFRNQEQFYINQVKTNFSCLLRLQRDGEENGNSVEKVGQLQSQVNLKDGVVIQVSIGNLTSYQADVVVNASNEELKHIGGLADALLKVAGPQLQNECDDLIKKHGRLRPGCAIITGAWNLPCKQVVHAVGPRWNSADKEKCIQILKKAVRESLKQAETFNHRSIAIPAISSGVFGFPLKECTRSIVTAIKETLEDSSESSSLKKICLVDTSERTVQAFSDALSEAFRNDPPQPTPLPPSQPASQSLEEGEGLIVTSAEGLKIMLEEKGIEDAMTDVVVSSIGEDLELGVGPLSKAVLQKAGGKLKAEYDEMIEGQGVQDDCIIQTRGYNLACTFVFHAIIPKWDAEKGCAAKKLKDIVRECLQRTENMSLKSVSFPAIGTGGFSFPNSEVAKLMFEEVLHCSSTENFKSLQEVHFLLHPKDKDNIQAFTEVFQSGVQDVPQSNEEITGFFGSLCTLDSGINEMQIGSIKFQSMIGDIVNANTDIIVNVTNINFNAKAGVSKAILEGAGPEVEEECKVLATQSHNGFVTTQGGNLMCKRIIHLAPCSRISTQVSKVLHECEAKKHNSVAFPVIGTGQAGKSPDEAADDMINAITAFASKQLPQHLKTIKVVVFQPHMQKSFYTTMKKREGLPLSTSESLFSKLKTLLTGRKPAAKKKRHLVLEKKIEMASFEICGESRKNVEDAEAWLKKLIFQEQTENYIVDDLIDMFDEAEIQTLKKLQETLNIAIHLDKKQSPPSILVSGIPRDVLIAFTEIQKLLKKLKIDQEEKFKAELVKNLVNWSYSTDGNIFSDFDSLANLHLEDAKINKKKKVTVQIQGKSYIADIKNMCIVDSQKGNITIKRVGKEEGKLLEDLPKQWESMKGHHVKLVLLHPTAGEYKDVEQKFLVGCPTFIIEKIERVQNPYLWQAYQVKKQQIDKKNGPGNNEMILFHGTPSSTLIPIYQTGFNRSYAGKNAAVIGNGTYFAISSSYSADDRYSTPDSNGTKYMYVARVLTGEYCVGRAGQIMPPPKNSAGFDLYDSVTDHMTRPSMFVIFHDAQAYPEYLVTFRRK